MAAALSIALPNSSNAASADPGQCAAYARGAVAQNDEAVRRGCGFGGARWQSNFDNHFHWCMAEGWLLNGTGSENNARAEALAKCPPKPDASPKTKRGIEIDNTVRVREFTKWIRDRYVAGQDENVWGRYGNWVGEGWWGGSEDPSRPGMLPPVDDLDATGQKHDMGYEIAEELGRGREGVKETYMLIADLIAIRDAMALDKNPSLWTHPAKDPVAAKMYVERLVIAFQSYQTRKNYLGSIPLKREDIGKLEIVNKMLDGLPDVDQFEKMQLQRVRQWRQKYDELQKKKASGAAPR